MWEPHARRVVEEGKAKYAATGAPWNETDADFTLMRQDFIEKHPEAAIGWMKAEIDAVKFMVDHPKETTEMLYEELTGYPKGTIWAAINTVLNAPGKTTQVSMPEHRLVLSICLMTVATEPLN